VFRVGAEIAGFDWENRWKSKEISLKIVQLLADSPNTSERLPQFKQKKQ
jgi:hypothetical protein